MRRILDWSLRQWQRLLTLKDAPHAVAGGVAIGIVIGFSPLFSVKTLLAIVLAWLCRCSKLAAVIVVTLFDLLLPLEPLLIHWQYRLGHWILRLPASGDMGHWDDIFLHWREWFEMATFTQVIWPTVVGSLVFSIPVAALAYYPMLRLIRRVPPEMLPEGGVFEREASDSPSEGKPAPTQEPPENPPANP